ncbi:MAG: hypothetical protein ACYTDT_02520 [Planctomycetota bacterium]|jgi:hypothetical protein
MSNNTTTPLTPKSLAEAWRVIEDMRTMLNDIAASATILGAAPFDGAPPVRKLAHALAGALLEYEIGLAELGVHEFHVKL